MIRYNHDNIPSQQQELISNGWIETDIGITPQRLTCHCGFLAKKNPMCTKTYWSNNN